MSPELLTKAIEHSRTIPSPHSALLLFPLAGALGHLAGDHSAVGNRDAAAILNVASAWDAPQDDQANIDWTRNTWRGLQPFSTGGVYVNFLAEDDGIDRLRAAYGKNYDRLSAVKAKWDPRNLFRTNQNIAPRQ